MAQILMSKCPVRKQDLSAFGYSIAIPTALSVAGVAVAATSGTIGATGILRNSRGQFCSSYLNNPGVREAGQTGAEKAGTAAAESVTCRARAR